MSKRISELTKEVEKLSVNAMDVDLIDALKNSKEPEAGSIGDSSLDKALLVIENIERKMLKKFEFVDARSKETDEQNLRMRNVVSNNQASVEQSNKEIKSVRENVNKVLSTITEMKASQVNVKYESDKNLVDQKNDLLEVINSHVKAYFSN